MAHSSPGRVAQFRPRPVQLLAIIRKAASDSRNVSFGSHALDRMEERGITTLDALRVLKSGDISGDVEAGKNQGEWKCKVVAPIRGSREVGVISIIMRSGRLFIKTVEWEDL